MQTEQRFHLAYTLGPRPYIRWYAGRHMGVTASLMAAAALSRAEISALVASGLDSTEYLVVDVTLAASLAVDVFDGERRVPNLSEIWATLRDANEVGAGAPVKGP